MSITEGHKANIDLGYEFYQIIKDFTNPVQILREAFQNSVDADATEIYCDIRIQKELGTDDLYIDIWDNGCGIKEEHIPNFYDLARSTKTTAQKTPTTKLGYKGHGTKIYFNCEKVEIFTKPDKNQAGWGIVLEEPLKQIRDSGFFKYSPPIAMKECNAILPGNFETGLFIRIKNPNHFKTQHTRYMLNHVFLRDYTKWYTVFSTIRPLFDADIPKVHLYLKGLNMDYFQKVCCDGVEIDPIPVLVEKYTNIFEEISLGHYFPPDRHDDKSMEAYVKKIGSNKPFYDYYSRQIYKNRVYLDSNIIFDFVIHSEGYETKRRYDMLLPRRGKSPFEKTIQHTDGERYGLWAGKGGIPIEKVDDWIVGGRGVGTYTYMHAFVDSNAFELTANRGSIKNTDVEILDKIKEKINSILAEKRIQKDLTEREDWEDYVKKQRTIDEDEKELQKRFGASKNRRHIVLPNGNRILEPSKTKSGFSESETLIVLIEILSQYPGLFTFNLLDYNTTKGIDFVVEKSSSPRYIELKGTFQKKVNHSFRNVYKFICYDIDMNKGEIIEDIEPLTAVLNINKQDKFQSTDKTYLDQAYTSYQIVPVNQAIPGMEIIVLKQLLAEVIGATFH